MRMSQPSGGGGALQELDKKCLCATGLGRNTDPAPRSQTPNQTSRNRIHVDLCVDSKPKLTKAARLVLTKTGGFTRRVWSTQRRLENHVCGPRNFLVCPPTHTKQKEPYLRSAKPLCGGWLSREPWGFNGQRVFCGPHLGLCKLLHTPVHVRTHVCTRTSAHMCAHACPHTCVYTHVRTHVCICMSAHMCAHACPHTSVYTHVRTHETTRTGPADASEANANFSALQAHPEPQAPINKHCC